MQGCSSAQPAPPLSSSPALTSLSEGDHASEPLQVEGDGSPSADPVCPACPVLSSLRSPLPSTPSFSTHQTGVGPFYWKGGWRGGGLWVHSGGRYPVGWQDGYPRYKLVLGEHRFYWCFSMVEREKCNNVPWIVWMPEKYSQNRAGTLLPQHCLWRCGTWSFQRTMTAAPADAWASVLACMCCCLLPLLKWEAGPALLRGPPCGAVFVTLGGSALLSDVLRAHRLGP